MTREKLIMGSILWVQTCLALGVLTGTLTFRDFIAIQVSIITLLVPSPIFQNKEDEDNEH
jgi:hypothetical protein